MFAEQFQFFEQRLTEALGGSGTIAGDVTNQNGEVLVGDLGYEDLESHDWRFFSTCSSGRGI